MTRNIDLRIKRCLNVLEKSLGCPYLNEGLRQRKPGNLDVGSGWVAGAGGIDDGAILMNNHLPPLPALTQHQNPPCLLYNNPSFNHLYLHVQFSIKVVVILCLTDRFGCVLFFCIRILVQGGFKKKITLPNRLARSTLLQLLKSMVCLSRIPVGTMCFHCV